MVTLPIAPDSEEVACLKSVELRIDNSVCGALGPEGEHAELVTSIRAPCHRLGGFQVRSILICCYDI